MTHLWSGRVPANRCPSCDHLLDAATASKFDARKPAPNDLSICINCLIVLQFDEDLQLKILTKNEQDKLPVEVTMQICKVKLAVTMIQQRHKDGKIP